MHRAYVPYSHRPGVAVVLLSDGTLVPGVRVESASFSLTISAVQNAITTAGMLLDAGRTIVAVFTGPSVPSELPANVEEIAGHLLQRQDSHFYASSDLRMEASQTKLYDPFIRFEAGANTHSRTRLARSISAKALVPESGFHVGCVLETDDNRGIYGVNIESGNWNDILCAERNAIGTAITYGAGDIRAVYVSAPLDVEASPCGACRQVLVELAQRAMVWMDRGENPPLGEPCTELLPYYFSGGAIHTPNRPS